MLESSIVLVALHCSMKSQNNLAVSTLSSVRVRQALFRSILVSGYASIYILSSVFVLVSFRPPLVTYLSGATTSSHGSVATLPATGIASRRDPTCAENRESHRLYATIDRRSIRTKNTHEARLPFVTTVKFTYLRNSRIYVD